MSLSQVLDRYHGSAFSIHGGDNSIVEEVRKNGIVVSWYVGDENKITDVTDIPERIIQIIVTIDGFLLGGKVEMTAASYLQSADVIIYHGYPEFRTTGLDVIKEVYSGGCVITKMSGEIHRLQKLASIIPNSPTITTPFQMTPSVYPLLAYTHIFSRLQDIISEEGTLRIPIKENIPTSISTADSIDHVSSSSVYIDKERKLLVSAIDLVARANVKDFILIYHGDLYIKWLPYFLSLFGYLNPTVHLWGSDQGVEIPPSRNVHIRPPDLGTDRPDVSLYLERYGQNNNILLLSDEDGQDLLDMSPLLAYVPYKGNRIRGSVVILPWTTVGRANVLYRRGDVERQSNISQGNINSFHMIDRMNSYNVGRVIDDELGSVSGVGRHLNIPSIGLCTCYDCASEVAIVSRYMRSRRMTYTSRVMEGLLTGNGPSLWTISKPMSQPDERINLFLRSEDIDQILHIDPYTYGNIGIDVGEDLLQSPSLYMEGAMSTEQRLRELLRGERWPLVVNFHKLVKRYDPARDKGRTGYRIYNEFLQSVALNQSSLDTYGMLILFILSRI